MTTWRGTRLTLDVRGESHGPQLEGWLTGLPSGIVLDRAALAVQMAQRAPGQGAWATARTEPDAVVFSAGLDAADTTTGEVICFSIANTNIRSADYEQTAQIPRPGHADFPFMVREHVPAPAGGGRFSGRLTAPIVAAGAFALQELAARGVTVRSEMTRIGSATGRSVTVTPVYAAEIALVKNAGDSVGGTIEVTAEGLPVGLGDGYFEGLDAALAAAAFGIPAVKAVEFGAGTKVATRRGSQNNDPFRMQNGRVVTLGNEHGGLLGGMTSGMPLVMRLSIKPTPSIAREQKSVDLARGTDTVLSVRGRHDPCIVPRAVPVARAMMALVLYDAVLTAEERTEE